MGAFVEVRTGAHEVCAQLSEARGWVCFKSDLSAVTSMNLNGNKVLLRADWRVAVSSTAPAESTKDHFPLCGLHMLGFGPCSLSSAAKHYLHTQTRFVLKAGNFVTSVPIEVTPAMPAVRMEQESVGDGSGDPVACTIDCSNSQCFRVTASCFHMRGLKIFNASGSAALSLVSAPGASLSNLIVSDNKGPALTMYESDYFALSSSVLYSNQAGGLVLTSSGTCAIRDVQFRLNTGNSGAGMRVAGISGRSLTVDLTDSVFEDNAASDQGGGLQANGADVELMLTRSSGLNNNSGVATWALDRRRCHEPEGHMSLRVTDTTGVDNIALGGIRAVAGYFSAQPLRSRPFPSPSPTY